MNFIKKFWLFIGFIILLFTTTCYSLTAFWNHSPSMGVTNYRVYWSTNKNGPYNNYIQVGYTTNAYISNTNFVIGQTNWFRATSVITNFNTFEESYPTTNDCYFILGAPMPVKNNHILEIRP